MESNKEAQKETRINTGLHSYRHPVAASRNMKDTPVSITHLSQNIVLRRDTAGQVYASENRCPHRGARLSMGWNLGDHAACWYRGAKVSDQGTVTSILAVDACPVRGKTYVRSCLVQKHAGAILLWFGGRAPSRFDDAFDTLRLPEKLANDEHSHFLCLVHWSINYYYVIDNVVDPMRGTYLHAVSYSMAGSEKKAVMEVAETDHGTMFQRTGQYGVNFDWAEFSETGTVWLRLSTPYQPKVGPGGPSTIIGIVTPVDEEHCIVHFWRARHVQGWRRNVWRFLYRDHPKGLYWGVLEQDHVALESMAPGVHDHEMLYQYNIDITRIRRVLARRIAAELANAPAAMIRLVPTEAQHA